MINWKTILSSFDDKPTLMQWLKIVEKALQNAALESVTVKTAPNNAVAFEFKFADGSTVTSTAANLEAKGISRIEEVSDEIVGNQTLTTLRAHYTDGTTDEFPVYVENGKSYIYFHSIKGKLDNTAKSYFAINFLSHDNTEITSANEFIKFFSTNKCYFTTATDEYVFYFVTLSSQNNLQIHGVSLDDASFIVANVLSISEDKVLQV